MLYVTTQPEALSATAANLAGIGAAMSAQNSAAADQVSALAAAQFAVHAEMYQAISAQAEAIHQQLVSTLETNALSYAATEAANAAAAG
jgi:Skp family chaperone for outer membrane proteins